MQNLKKKWIAWLAVVCMLATMIPLSVVMATAEDVNTGEAVFSDLKLQLIHRLPSQSDTDHKSALSIFVSGDGENWSDAYTYTTEGSGKWLCDNLPTIDLTEQAKIVTGHKLYIKIGLGAGDAGWCAIHQLRVEGTYADEDTATEFVWDKYEDLPANSGTDNASAAAAVVSAVPGIVAANNVKLGSCVVDGCGKTAIIPYYAGSYAETGAYITYAFDLKGSEPEQPDVPDVPATGRFSDLKLQLIHRLPSQGDTDHKSALNIFVSGDGENWSDAYVHTTQDAGKWLCDTLPTIDLTALAANVTGDKLYIKVGIGAGDPTWCMIHQLRIEGTYAGESTATEFVWDKYESLAANAGTDNASAAAAVVAAVPGIVDANNVKLAACVVDGCGKTGIMPYYAGSFAETNGYITYGFDLNSNQPIVPDEPVEKEKYTLDDLTFEYLGRLPENGEGKNKVHVALSKDGENWTEVYILNPFKDASGQAAWLGGQYSGEVNLAAAAADFIGTELTDLYVRIGLNAGINNWCAVEQIRFNGKVNGGDKQELLYEKYDTMTHGSSDYRTAKYIDSDLIRLAKISYDGAYVGTNPQPDNKIVTLQPGEPYDLKDPQPYRCYITYKLLGEVDPNEVKPDDGGNNPDVPGDSGSELLSNTTNLGYAADFDKMENGATDWYKDVYEISAMKVFYDAGDNYTMLCPDSSKNQLGIGYVTYKVVGAEGQNLGLVGVSMKGRVFDLDADDSRGLTVEYSLDDGATWKVAKHIYSTTQGMKTQSYNAVLGMVQQDSVLVRIKMSSGMNDWVGLTDLAIMAPTQIAPGFYENFDGMRPGSMTWQNNVFNFNMMRLYTSPEGYSTLTTNMEVTDQGKGYVEYLIAAEEGKTLDGLKAIIIGRIFDFDNDVNRGLTVTCSDDYGVTYYDGARVAAGENSEYSQEYVLDLSAAAAGKNCLLVRIETNSKYWDWVGMESLEFVTDDYTPPAGGDDDDDDDGNGGSTPILPGDDDDDGDPILPGGDDDDGDEPSPETGDTVPYMALVLLMAAAMATVVLRKKQAN